MGYIVAELIFLLIAQHRECSNGSQELVVAERLQTRYGSGRGREGKRKRKAEVRVARFGEVQSARAEHQRSNPSRAPRKLIADNQVHVVVVRLSPSGRQSGLLHPGVVRNVVVDGRTQEPLRARRLRPIKSNGAQT